MKRNIAATAFGIHLRLLLAPGTAEPITTIRQKIICFVRLVTGEGLARLAHAFDRDTSTIHHAILKFRGEIEPLLGDAVVPAVVPNAASRQQQ
jgi:chromosomal replication initiation ATPase DnaA